MPSDDIRKIALTLPAADVERLRGMLKGDESVRDLIKRIIKEAIAPA
jgi:hypothetical protein